MEDNIKALLQIKDRAMFQDQLSLILTKSSLTELLTTIEEFFPEVNPRLYVFAKIVFRESYDEYITHVLPEYCKRIETNVLPDVLNNISSADTDKQLEVLIYINTIAFLLKTIVYLLETYDCDARPIVIKWYTVHESVQTIYDNELFKPYL